MSEESTYGRERYRKVTLPGNAWAETWLQRRGERVEMQTSFQNSSGSGSSGGGGSGYQRCAQHGCLGEALPDTGNCFAHSLDSERAQLLNQVPGSNRALCLRGTSISQTLWNQIANSPMFAGGVLCAPIMLAGAEIDATIRIEGVTFNHYIELTSATVFQHIEFKNCVFRVHFNAHHSFFDGGAINCNGSTFCEDVDLSFLTVERTSFGFEGCTFERAVNLNGFTGAVHLNKSNFRGNVTCRDSKAFLILNGSEFHGALDLTQSELVGLQGERLVVHSTLQLGRCAIPHLYLQRSTFNSRVHIDVLSTTIDLSGAVMKEGGLLLIEKAQVRLDQLSLGGPLRVSGKANSREPQPEILGLLNADAGRMSLSRVNLTRCSFVGAHGLGAIDIESTVTFARAPYWAGGRKFIADEYAWRIGTGKLFKSRWKLDGVHVGAELPKPVRGSQPPILLTPLVPAQVESLYRELRRSLETKSDMPGAADFYFGEMEMRRWGGAGGTLERALIWCYWGLSGYGLRPGRALLVWLLLVAVGAFGLIEFQLPTSHATASETLLVAVRASIPGFVSATNLSPVGQWIETGIRVVGIVLIALFLLATRSTVMRKPSE
jgi:uncharacterized protein YjbI with pentapeptide repeats